MDDGFCICPVLCVFCCMDVCRCMRDHISEKFENTAAHPAGHDKKARAPPSLRGYNTMATRHGGAVLTRLATAGQRRAVGRRGAVPGRVISGGAVPGW